MRYRNKTDEFYKTPLEEQETIINIDYDKRVIHIYTSKKVVYDRLIKKIGEPIKIYTIKGQISGANWKIPFNSKLAGKLLSRPTFIGAIK